MKLVTYFILIVLFAFPSTVLGKETLPILMARCHMDVCHWWRIKEVRDSRFPDRPDIGWNPEKRILKNQLANPFFLLRKKPFVVNLLFDHGYTYHRCSDGYKDEIISCSEFGPQNDEYPSNWAEDYPWTFADFTFKFQKYVDWQPTQISFHCSKQFPAVEYGSDNLEDLERGNTEIEVFQFLDWYHSYATNALYFHFCHNLLFHGFENRIYYNTNYPSLAKQMGYPEYVYNMQLPVPTFPSWNALINFNK